MTAIPLDQALQQAIAHHRAGRLPDAEKLYRTILQAQPHHPDANHNLGVLAVNVNQPTAALPFFQAALEANPAPAQYWLSHLDALIRAGQPDAARQALALARQNGVPEENLRPFEERLCAKPSRAEQEALVELFNQGRYPEMETRARELIQRFPVHPFGWETLAPALKNQKKYAEANAAYREALQRDPDSTMTLSNFADCLNCSEQHEEAIIQAKRALEIDRQHVGALVNLGNAYNMLGQHDAALQCYQQALTLDPKQVKALNSIGTMANMREDWKTALPYFEQALVINPDFVDAMNNKANALIALGKLDEARSTLDTALTIAPENPESLYVLASLQKAIPESPAFEILERAASTTGNVERRNIHFTLGKMYDEVGQYPQAFAHYLSGNILRRAIAEAYDQTDDEAWFRIVRRWFTPETFTRLKDAGLQSSRPIFIIGFPRSGTTLTEQILASHTQVFGAGELNYFRETVTQLGEYEGDTVAINVARPLQAEDIHRIAQGYLDFLDGLDNEAAHVVDKMPHNFERLGLIALCFPKATILHVERDTVDTCLSCFFQNFSGSRHGYSDDLTDLGRHYLYYRAMMDYWRAVLPVKIHTVRYEALVSEPEAQIPALLDACGLEMDENCLTPHRTERSVRTCSKVQVREPIHRASVQKWRRYKQELQSLLTVLREGGIDV